MAPKTIILIGQSGCGKGTQSKLLEEFFKKEDPARPVLYVEIGMKFREFVQDDGYSSVLSKEIYEKNEPQPDFLVIWIWARFLIEKMTGEEHVIIDGTPRSLFQAQVLMTALAFYGRRASIFHLNISREVAESRLIARGRSDDINMTKINKRLDWFYTNVVPAIDFFKTQKEHDFFELDAESSVENVHTEIVAALGYDLI